MIFIRSKARSSSTIKSVRSLMPRQDWIWVNRRLLYEHGVSFATAMASVDTPVVHHYNYSSSLTNLGSRNAPKDAEKSHCW